MWHILVFAHSVLHRMLIGHSHSCQLLEWQNLGITTLKHAKFRYHNTKACYMYPKCFLKIAGKSNNY